LSFDRFEVCAAYKIVAERHYSSQWSKGYEKLSQLERMGYREGLASWRNEKHSPERNAAAALLKRDRREIRLTW
jgi:hypothetical protein